MVPQVSPDAFASDSYRATLRAKHGAESWGGAGKSWAFEVIPFAASLGAKTVLDYGCGRATLAAAVAPLAVGEYDPGIIGKDALPDPADLVVSTDVLEHVEPERLDAVLAHIRGLARKGVFLVIACSPSKTMLPDGRNAHLIVESPEWWRRRLVARGWRIDRWERRKGIVVWERL